MYDYREAVKADIITTLNAWEEDNGESLKDFTTIGDAFNYFIDDMYITDTITGNASGSYYCNAWKAEEALSHNFNLLAEAAEEFGLSASILNDGPEAADVIIRCYLLHELLWEALEELTKEGANA